MGRHTTKGVSKTLKQPVSVALDLVNRKVGLAIFSRFAAGNIAIINTPSEFLAAVANSPWVISEQCIVAVTYRATYRIGTPRSNTAGSTSSYCQIGWPDSKIT